MGISAPKSSNAGLSNQDSNSVLSFEVVKLMLEKGGAHALMVAIKRIRLHDPMVASTASTIVRPLEIAPCALWSVPCGLWSVPCGLWSMPCGLWSMPCGLCPVVCGLCPVPCGLCPVPCGLCPVVCAL